MSLASSDQPGMSGSCSDTVVLSTSVPMGRVRARAVRMLLAEPAAADEQWTAVHQQMHNGPACSRLCQRCTSDGCNRTYCEAIAEVACGHHPFLMMSPLQCLQWHCLPQYCQLAVYCGMACHHAAELSIPLCDSCQLN
jgi:hypothetical protein